LDFNQIARELTDIEKKSLSCLAEKKEATEKQVAELGKLNIDSARRALGWLTEKQLVNSVENAKDLVYLTPKGEEAKSKGTPEQRLMDILEAEGRISIDKLKVKAGLNEAELNIALGYNKKNSFIVFSEIRGKKFVEPTEVAREYLKENTGAANAIDIVSKGKKISDNEKKCC